MTADNLMVIKFAEAKLPVFSSARYGRFMRFGEDNLYPDYLQWLYDNATKHGALIDGKVTYIIGKGWQAKNGTENPQAAAFIDKVNRYGESLADVSKKACLDIEIFAGAYLQVIWSNSGRIAEIYHLDYTRMRSNADNTQFFYKEKWDYSRRTEKEYPAFNPANPRGSQILFIKEYRPGSTTYPLPRYMRTINYINAEIEVGKHTNGNATTGFTPSKAITLTNGEPTEEEKKKITRRFEKAFTGADGKKFILWFTPNTEKKPIIDDLGASDLTKEDFTAVDNLIQSNIYAGHQITTPALFGISTAGSLGQAKEIRDGYEVFKNTYVNDKQQFLEAAFNRIAKYAGVASPLSIIPTAPIGIDLDSVKDFAPKSWLLEQIGVDPAKYPDAATGDNNGAPQQGMAGQPGGNEAIRSLSAKQHQQLMRIIRQVGKGQLTEAAAKVLLRNSLGLSDEDIAEILGTNEPTEFGDQIPDDDDDTVVALFAECGEDKSKYEVVKTKKIKFADEEDEAMFLQFKTAEVSSLEASVLDLISKDKRISPETIATTLKIETGDVQTAIDSLLKSGALKVTGKPGEEIRTLTKPLRELQDGVKAKTREYSVKYSYDGPQDSRNRPFCAKMMALGRYYTRTEIESISQRLGYSVWDRRGGFYHNPVADVTTPYCRHNWFSHLVQKKEA